MPGIVKLNPVIEQLELILLDLSNGAKWPAFVKMKFLVDSMLPFCCDSTTGVPLKLPEGSLGIFHELEDSLEKDTLVAGGANLKKIDGILLAQDLEEIRYKMELMKYDGIVEKIELILLDLKKRMDGLDFSSRYDDFSHCGDVVLEARTEVKKVSQVIATESVFAEVVPVVDCVRLLEKFIDKAYFLGRDDVSKEFDLKKVDGIKQTAVHNFTGFGRDVQQFSVVWQHVFACVHHGGMGRPLRFLFVGCSSGEEILDFQNLFEKELIAFNDFLEKSGDWPILREFFPKMVFYGVDSSKEMIENARQKNFLFETRFFVQNVLDFNQEIQVNFNETDEKQNPTFLTFDVIVCRNLLIYWGKDEQQRLMQKFSKLCNTDSLVVFGLSDPLELAAKKSDEGEIVGVENDFFESFDFENKIFCLKFSEERHERLLDLFWEGVDFYRMSLFNRFPQYKPFELKAVQKVLQGKASPRILIVGGGLGHQVYEISIMVAEECKRIEKSFENIKIVALEPFALYAVQIMNGHVCANDLEELNSLQKQYFFKKPHPMKGLYYMALNRELVPEIVVVPKDAEEFAKNAKKPFDLIFCYKVFHDTPKNEQDFLKKISNLVGDNTIIFLDHATITPENVEF